MDRFLEAIDIKDPAGVQNWHERFNCYVQTNDKITAANQTAFYLTMIGKDAYDLLNPFGFCGTKMYHAIKCPCLKSGSLNIGVMSVYDEFIF